MCIKSKSQVYVEDLRTVMLFNGKILKYPKNYHDIVQNGTIRFSGIDSDGNPHLELVYGNKATKGKQLCWTLTHVAEDECHSKAYYTMYSLVYKPVEELGSSFYEPFKFSRLQLRKYAPVIDIKKTGDHDNPYILINSLYLAKEGCSINKESGEVDDNSRKEKGLNGKLLYYSTYDKQDPRFFVIRDENDRLEIDKSIICFVISLFVYTVIFLRKFLTFLPMIVGEWFLSHQNVFSKVLGNIFFTPFVPFKFLIDMLAIFVKITVLLFAADEKKYGNKYYILWKSELMECFRELKSDCLLIKSGKRSDNESEYGVYKLIGTWDELNVRAKKNSADLP